MEDLDELLKNMSVTLFEKDSAHWVKVVYIIDPHNFFVRLTKYRFIMKLVKASKPFAKPSHMNIQSTVLFTLNTSSVLPKYARGILQHVQKVEDTYLCDIYAQDYGFYEKDVPYERIWECDEKFLHIPPLAMNCQLAFCAPKGGKEWGEATAIFKKFVGNERAKMIISDRTSEKLIVTLYNTNPEDIATLLALTGYTTLGYVHAAVNKVKKTLSNKIIIKSFYEYKKLEQDTTLHVRTLSGESLDTFYVAEINDYRIYLDKHNDISLYTSREPNINEKDLNPGDIVSVQHCKIIDHCTREYERGVIKYPTANSKVVVHLVDLGKEVTVPVTKIRKLPAKYLDMPILAIFCAADNISILDDDQRHQYLSPGYEFLITILQTGDQHKTPNFVSLSTLPVC